MPGWIQVVLLILCLVVCAGGVLVTRRFCRQRKLVPSQTVPASVATGAFLLYFLLCAIPTSFTVLGVSTYLGLLMTMLDFLVLLVSVILLLWRHQRQEIKAFIEAATPPDP